MVSIGMLFMCSFFYCLSRKRPYGKNINEQFFSNKKNPDIAYFHMDTTVTL
jgi:hypothetical protein